MLVDLQPVAQCDATILANLLQLYCHELSPYFALKIGADGRYGYPRLPLYWTEPERRFPFFITAGGELAGFALVTRGSPASEDPAALDVAEFFVLRSYRRSGVGARAASLLWDRFAGHWVVRAAVTHTASVQFWRCAVQAYARGAPTVERTLVLGGVERQVFEFDSPRRADGSC